MFNKNILTVIQPMDRSKSLPYVFFALRRGHGVKIGENRLSTTSITLKGEDYHSVTT